MEQITRALVLCVIAALTGLLLRKSNPEIALLLALLRGSIVPTHYFVYLRERPAAEHPGLMTLPAGNWLCMQSRILAEPFPGPELKRYFRDQETPRLVVANEYEDNFRSFRNCIYEVQIFQHS